MSVQVIGCLSATVLYLCFFFTASKLQFRHRVEGLRTHRFWLARARLVVAFGLFGSVASSFGTMWKGCERTVFGCLFSGLCFACLGHEACCRSRLSEASHRGILLGVRSNPAAACSGVSHGLLHGRHHGTSAEGLAWALLSAPPRHLALRYTGFGPSLAARVLATRNVLWIPKVTGSIFSGLCFWLA